MQKRIMIVDDSQEITYTVKEGLEELDPEYKVICADSGKQFFRLLDEKGIPDLILLDIMMPEMNGWEVLKKLKETKKWSKIPIVFLTAKTDNFSRGFGKLLAQNYIEKPFLIENLKKAIDTQLKDSKGISETKERIVGDIIKNWVKTDIPKAKMQINAPVKKIMIVDDEDDVRNMINVLIQKEGYETEMATDGADFLKKIDIFQPDLVTLDVMMPGMTTPEIFHELEKKHHKPKIIMLTVVKFSNEEKKYLFNSANIVDYFTKPFDIEKFVDSVKTNL